MTVTIYTKPSGCFGCNKTKQLFTEAGLSFHEEDITGLNPTRIDQVIAIETQNR